jgi:hypothetical protein
VDEIGAQSFVAEKSFLGGILYQKFVITEITDNSTMVNIIRKMAWREQPPHQKVFVWSVKRSCLFIESCDELS